MKSVCNTPPPAWSHTWWAFPLAAVIFLALVTIVAAASAGSARADAKSVDAAVMDMGGLYLPAREPWRVRAAPLVGSEVDIDVSGLIARARITHHFKNPTGRWTEAVYPHPLPPDSAVDKMTLTVDGRVTDGKIAERAEAKRQCTAAKQSDRRASLIEQERPNIFTTAVANIGPGETVSVAIEYQERLNFRDGQFTLRLPLVVGPRHIPGGAEPVKLDQPGGGWAKPAADIPDAVKITSPLRSK
ncbi:MAG: VIT domain-containing protein [Rhodospirillaceae bacterium]